MRVGFGYDVHRLVAGRELVLGGVRIAFEKGLLGHSDADVLLHAICDALLGAAALGDIGQHFPDSDPAYAGAASTELLRRSRQLVADAGFRVHNVDAVVVAQAPAISPHRERMRAVIADCLEIDPERVSVKATTTEGLGATGRGEAMAAMATALISRPSPR